LIDRWTVVDAAPMVIIVLLHRWRDLHDVVVRRWVIRLIDWWTVVPIVIIVLLHRWSDLHDVVVRRWVM